MMPRINSKQLPYALVATAKSNWEIVFYSYDLTQLKEVAEADYFAESYDPKIYKAEIWDLTNTSKRRLSDLRPSKSPLASDTAIAAIRELIAARQNTIGPLGKYFYKSKALHYMGVLLFIALFLIVIASFIIKIRNQTANAIDYGLIISYVIIGYFVYQESNEVRGLWRYSKQLESRND